MAVSKKCTLGVILASATLTIMAGSVIIGAGIGAVCFLILLGSTGIGAKGK